MTENIDLGDNPFGAFVGKHADEAAASNEDLLPDLMKESISSPSKDATGRSPAGPTIAPANMWGDAAIAPAFAEDAPVTVESATSPPTDPVRVAASPAEGPRAMPAEDPAVSDPRAERPTAPLPGVRPPEPIDQRKLWLLRILLISNLAMMLVMLLLPHPMETRTEYTTNGPSSSGEGGVPNSSRNPNTVPMRVDGGRSGAEPFVQPPRAQSLGLPNDPLYEKALMQALDGDFNGASATLRAFLVAHPALDPALERLVHAHLAYYLRKAGDLSGAIDQETKARQMAGRAFLPEELLRAAREAELRGDGDGMRRAYAQFLLQEDQLPPALKALVQEAYLKLGDAYRIEAERAESAAPVQDGNHGGRGSAGK